MHRMGQQQSQVRATTTAPQPTQAAVPSQSQAAQQPTSVATMQKQSTATQPPQADLTNKQGSITSLAAHHAAAKLAAQLTQSGGVAGGAIDSKSTKSSRSNSFSSGGGATGPFESQTQIKDTQPAAAAAAAPTFPSRPVSSRGHMLPQSAQMISEKERQREAEMEHVFTPQTGQIIAERCTTYTSARLKWRL